MTQNAETEREFLRGFALGMTCPIDEAGSNWADFSRQLSDAKVAHEESLGYDRGYELGIEYAAMEANTPGDGWRMWDPEGRYPDPIMIIRSDDQAVASVDIIDDDHQEQIARARLIAAAPELYAALKKITEHITEHLEQEAKDGCVAVSDLCPCWNGCVRKARAALSLVEGVQS